MKGKLKLMYEQMRVAINDRQAEVLKYFKNHEHLEIKIEGVTYTGYCKNEVIQKYIR